MRIGNSPSYLAKNSYSFCFRIKIPKDLQCTVCKEELRYSLGAGILSDAKPKARFVAGQVQFLFRNIPNTLPYGYQLRMSRSCSG